MGSSVLCFDLLKVKSDRNIYIFSIKKKHDNLWYMALECCNIEGGGDSETIDIIRDPKEVDNPDKAEDNMILCNFIFIYNSDCTCSY